MNTKRLLALLLASCLLLAAGCASEAELTYKQAEEKLNAFARSGITGQIRDHLPDPTVLDEENAVDELPPIDKYPLSVRGGGAVDVEIFSSTEKSSAAADKWMEVMARQFNQSAQTVNGKTASVSVRPINSGLALDYIQTRAYVPAAYSPANELWGEMIRAAGVTADLAEKSLTGNTAGILMKKSTYEAYKAKYGDVTMAGVVEAALAGDIVLGHTDPNQSSTGLNIFTQELLAFDPENPLGEAAAAKFREFQNTVPPVSPTTADMAKIASKGILDAMIMESQAWRESLTDKSAAISLADWRFTPLGVRHDSPLYALEGITPEQRQALELFAKYCRTDAAQKSASSFGFNQFGEYKGAPNRYTGIELFSALKLWKDNKDGGHAVVTVFVMDCSASMEGEKLLRSKQALINSARYISEENYIGLVSYSSVGRIFIDLPIGKFTPRQHALLAGAVRELDVDGQTATNDAIVVALGMLLKAKETLPNAKMQVLVFTDGEQNAGLGLAQIQGLVNGLAIPVIGVGFEANLADLQALAEINEGYCINADQEDVIYKLRGLFTAQM